MGMYRCAACGSSHVVVDTKKEGFSVSKAVAGTVLFGTGGAVMGVNGKEQLYYHCAACGQTLSYPMPDFKKDTIDKYLSAPEKYRYFLEREKKQYPNIEWSADSTETLKASVQIAEKLSESELADAIWNYYLKYQIPYVSIQTLGNEILRDDYNKIIKVLEILENRGVLIIEQKDDANYCRFCSDAEEIKNNLYIIQNRNEQERDAAAVAKLACFRELSRIRKVKSDSKMLLTGAKYERLKAAVLEALSGDVKQTIADLQATSEICVQYSKQHLSANLKQMVDEGILEKIKEENATYYSLPGATMRNKEKERQRLLEEENKRIAEEKERQRLLAEAKAHNEKVNEQIAALEKERAEQETIVSQNALKFLGAGAQAKREAQKKISDIDAKISDLRSSKISVE